MVSSSRRGTRQDSSTTGETVAEGLGARAATVGSIDDLAGVDVFRSTDPDGPLVLDARTVPGVIRPGFPPY